MTHYTTVSRNEELLEILALQKKNLSESISVSEKETEGFVTVRHNFDVLKNMNNQQSHIIAKDNDQVVGYTLCMTKEFAGEIEILKPMFQKISQQLNREDTYLVMGQICIDKAYRGQGVFRGLYQKMKSELKEKYDLLITEVASNNLRSLKAHKAIGFKNLITYESDGIEWHLISWNWE
ncbi:GNAT family N-acetyltransferase [Aquimarina sp. SS2-1]|uniref:GNAT family N-acetyltransferase n=1 Tax=Aquimarina besae TaxID=3342247 RepID=UPI00366DFD43